MIGRPLLRLGVRVAAIGMCCALLLCSVSPASADDERKKDDEQKKKKSVLEQFAEDFEDGKDKKKHERDDEDGWVDTFLDILGFVFRLGSTGPHEGEYPPRVVVRPLPWRFEAYPYAAEAFGYRSDVGRRHFVVPRIAVHHLSSGLDGVVAEGDLRFWSRSGFLARYAQYTEELLGGDRELDVAALAFKLTAVQTRRFYLEGGLGAKGLRDELWRWGPNLGLWARAFPVAPLVLDLGLETATINENPLGEVSLGVGLMYNNLEFRVGFRSLQSEHHALNGLEMGVGGWF